ncbi:ECF transporter S component [Granulicatella balaenopterae]|nr:ECF transporter S component [Granulicatella balaenopterae]
MTKNKKISIAAMAVAINLIGGLIAFALRLPIYMDSLGTILVAFVFGPFWAAGVGAMSSIVNGILFDYFSFFFLPAQVLLGILAGSVKGVQSGRVWKKGVSTFAVSIPVSIVSAIIAAKVFGTITSSGSSYIVQLLRVAGMSDISAVFIVQFLTDYADKLFAVLFASEIIRRLNKR